MPFSTGMEISSTTTSGSSRAASSSIACPLPTVLMTSKCGSRCWTTGARKSAGSSASRTFTRGNGIKEAYPFPSGKGYLAKLTAEPVRRSAYAEERDACEALQGDDALLDGELDQLGAGLDAELFHHAVLVERDGPRSDLEDGRDFLHRSSFRK